MAVKCLELFIIQRLRLKVKQLGEITHSLNFAVRRKTTNHKFLLNGFPREKVWSDGGPWCPVGSMIPGRGRRGRSQLVWPSAQLNLG